jgi:hypothetical protein
MACSAAREGPAALDLLLLLLLRFTAGVITRVLLRSSMLTS